MGKNAKPGQGTDGPTICVEMMDITDRGATENQAAGITVLSGIAKNVIKVRCTGLSVSVDISD